MKQSFIVLTIVLISLTSCSLLNKTHKNDTTTVVIHTTEGDITAVLYNETPQHRDNFIKLINNNFYEGILFHRVIKDFMIQTGDPESVDAPIGKQLGSGGPGYTIPAEFNDSLFHKKGALAAARQGDQANPQKESSGSQFYIVHGKVHTLEELTQMENQMNMQKKQAIFNEYIQKDTALQQKIQKMQQDQDRAGLEKLGIKLQEKVEDGFVPFKFSEKQKTVYTTIGGTPFLDGNYTVFGEVTEGLEVVEKIAQTKTGKGDRPLKNIKIESIEIKK